MGKIFFRGIVGIAPLAITTILVIWLFKQLEWLFGTPIKELIGPDYYFTGLGVLVAIVVLFFTGLILNYWVVQSIYNKFEALLKRIPLFKTIYTSVSDLMSFFSSGNTNEQGKMVMVLFDGLKAFGLVTRETFEDLPKGIASEEEVAVFFPFSYQIGGVTLLVPKSRIIPVDFTLEQGLRFVITAGSPSADKPTYPLKKN